MLENNSTRLIFAVIAIIVSGTIYGVAKANYPDIVEGIGNRISQTLNNNTVKGKDIDGVSNDDITDPSKINNINFITKVIKIRDATNSISAVYIKIQENDGGYEIVSAGTTDTTDDANNIYGGSLYIPNSVDGKSINKIDNNVFQKSNFSGELTLPRDLQYVGENAFQSSVFTGKLVLPTEMWGVQNNAFQNSVFTGTLSLPTHLTIIGSYAFKSSIFTGKLSLPASTTIINEGSFLSSRFSGNLSLPNNLTMIGPYALINSNFSGNLIMPDTLNYFGGQIFNNSKFSGELHISNNLENMYANNFSQNNQINSNFNKITGGDKLKKLIKIKESSADDENDLSNATGIFFNGNDLKNVSEINKIKSTN